MQARPGIRDSRRWLCAVARNHCLDLLRKRSRRTRVITQLGLLTGEASDPGQQVATRDLARQTLRRLKPRERAILWRSLVEGASLQELAVEFRLTYHAAAKLLHRSRCRSQALIRAISALILPDLFRILESLVRLAGRAERRAADLGAADAFDKAGLVVPAAVIGTLAAGSVAISAPAADARSPEPIVAAISTELEPTGGASARPTMPSLRLHDGTGIKKTLLPPKSPASDRPPPAAQPGVADRAVATDSTPAASVPAAAATGAGVAVTSLPSTAPVENAPSTASIDGVTAASPSPQAIASPTPTVDPTTASTPVPSPSSSQPDAPVSAAPIGNSALGPNPTPTPLRPDAVATARTNPSPSASCPAWRHRGRLAPSASARPICVNGAAFPG